MTDYSELKRLAEAAIQEGKETGQRWPEGDDWFEPELCSAEMGFVKAASPAAVLALIAENEQLKASTESTMGVGSGSGKLFVHGDYDSIKVAQAIVLERDQLKAENEALKRTEAGLHEMLRRQNKEITRLKADNKALRKESPNG